MPEEVWFSEILREQGETRAPGAGQSCAGAGDDRIDSVTFAATATQPEPQAAQDCLRPAFRIHKGCVELGVAALQESLHRRCAGGLIHATTHRHATQHSGGPNG